MADQALDDLRGACTTLCGQIGEHLKLLRDYATTPGDIWLAKGELSKISGLISEMETLLTKIKRAEQPK